MTYEAEFDTFLPETVTYEPYLSEDGYGARTFGAAKSVLARVENKTSLVRDISGREVPSRGRLFMKPTATDASAVRPTIKDRVTLPASYSPQAPPIIDVLAVNDSDGVHHYELVI